MRQRSTVASVCEELVDEPTRSIGTLQGDANRAGRVEQAWTSRAVGKAAVPFMINRTAAGLHDLDLRKAVLVARLFGSVSPDHDLDGDEWQKCITD